MRSGKLEKRVCEICQAEDTIPHHDDYDLPLDVRWLCQAHNVQWHKENGPGLNGE